MIYVKKRSRNIEIYSANFGIHVGGLAHLSFLVLITCGDIYNECNYAPLGGDHYAVPVCDNYRR